MVLKLCATLWLLLSQCFIGNKEKNFSAFFATWDLRLSIYFYNIFLKVV